jgi:hypothetical protein
MPKHMPLEEQPFKKKLQQPTSWSLILARLNSRKKLMTQKPSMLH